MNDSQHPVESPEPRPDAAASAAFAARRRRLLKIAGGAAPASLLLVGRPVHATYNCISTSAWGSAMASASAGTGSSAGTKIDGWSHTHWCGNQDYAGYGKPWNVLCSNLKKHYDKWGNFNYTDAKKKLTLEQCGLDAVPSGLAKTELLDAALNGRCSGSSDFTRAVLVALLNQKLLSNSSYSPTNCAPSSHVRDMATGSFDPKSGKSAWGRSEITDYVVQNNLARPK
ncbi:hypothetical protein [Rubrivivax gelatinosus]|uniref:Uncharacterized protein n=1 Tax=Rubrivivax gelatinosus TaxID=28068 RepID=A0A4R2MJW0_RUBGE|nr:hypothetical protein [Rubrivivax gelatinosus]MBK1686140.1 hypothetical protein [Rubrivivax gelatinosus]TCP05635.1 hypothetical protein EV684_101507 [Rubrivivax gelatinosus]